MSRNTLLAGNSVLSRGGDRSYSLLLRFPFAASRTIPVKKWILHWLIPLTIVFMPAIGWGFSGSGLGTAENPYVITTVTQLQEMQDDLGACYILGNDIDATATSTWNSGAGFAPVGSTTTPFTGQLDGQDYAIQGLYINRPANDSIGLFHTALDAEIKNAGLSNVNITGYTFTGSLVGKNTKSMVINCWSSGSVTCSTTNNYAMYVGGLIGSNENYSFVSQCYSSATVSGSKGEQYGGLIGLHSAYSILEDSYARGNVTGYNKVGGLVGNYSLSHIARCYSTGRVTGTGGGLIGYNPNSTVTYDSYWDINTSTKTTSKGGTGKTTAQMKQQSTYANWDFITLWNVEEGVNYPVLRDTIVITPVINTNPASLRFTSYLGGPNPNPKTVTIGNSGTDSLHWQGSTDASWLTTNVQSGAIFPKQSQDVTLNIDITGLSDGTYEAAWVISDENASNSPQSISITLTIYSHQMPLCVPDDYPTIQSAIDEALTGDTVIVKPGTYTGAGNRDIDLKGKAITVQSTDPTNPDVVAGTIIDCQGNYSNPHRGFIIYQNVTNSTIIDGLTIQNGFIRGDSGLGFLGAGILVESGSPIIRNCRIINNGGVGYTYIESYGCDSYGGGIVCLGSPVLENCYIANNYAYGGNGDILTWLDQGFRGGQGFGGGVYADEGVIIRNCQIVQNTARGGFAGGPATWREQGGSGMGGGVFMAGMVHMSNCIVSGNCAIEGGGNPYGGAYGAGIYCSNANISFDNDNISLNVITAPNSSANTCKGGGIYLNQTQGEISNCMISGNSAKGDGGGMYNVSSGVSMKNCVVSDNVSLQGAVSGIYSSGSTTKILNSIVWQNLLGATPGGQISGLVETSYTDVQGGYIGLGNIDIDPLFANPVNNDYHLKSQAGRWNGMGWVIDSVTSPCIDTGCPGTPLGEEPADVNNVRVNMGVYGGTAQASKSPAGWGCLTDSNNDGRTNTADLLILRSSWLYSGKDMPSDFNRDEKIGTADLLRLRSGWLSSAGWFTP